MSVSSRRGLAPGRRRFLKLVGFAGISSAVGSTMFAWAQTGPPGVNVSPKREPSPRADATSKTPADTTHGGAAKPPEISEDARALAAIVQRRYGKHLNPKQLEAVTTEIDGRIQGGVRLRAVKLANSDEPDVTFKA
jgi:hypothetical protein